MSSVYLQDYKVNPAEGRSGLNPPWSTGIPSIQKFRFCNSVNKTGGCYCIVRFIITTAEEEEEKRWRVFVSFSASVAAVVCFRVTSTSWYPVSAVSRSRVEFYFLRNWTSDMIDRGGRGGRRRAHTMITGSASELLIDLCAAFDVFSHIIRLFFDFITDTDMTYLQHWMLLPSKSE